MIVVVIDHEHQIGRLDISVDPVLTIGGNQRAGDLAGNTESEVGRKRAVSLDSALYGFPFHILHRVVEASLRIAKVEDGCNIRMPEARCRPCLPKEAL